MRLCHVVPSLEDRHGGPSRSVRALADAAARIGLKTTVAATHDPRHALAATDAGAAALRLFPRDVPRWLCRSAALRRHLLDERYDCIHAHALWLLTLDYARAASARHHSRFVISPRGMLSPWAYGHNRWKKRLAELLVHPGAFRAAHGWHATSTAEADDIRRLGFTQPICVAPNGVTLPTDAELAAARDFWLARCPALAGRRVAVFYSRLHRKKRVRELIDSWARLRTGDWFLLVIGTPEEYTPEQVQGWIASAGVQGRAAAFSGEGVPPPYGVGSLFLLPTHSENFGLVIAEALAAGLPAITTDQTPWHGLDEREAGWCVAWENWDRTLAAALAESPAQLEDRGRRGRSWVMAKFTWEGAARMLKVFYRDLKNV